MLWLVGAVLLMWLAWGPVVLLVAAALLCVPRVRWWVQDRAYVPGRDLVRVGAGTAVVLALVWAVPDGWFPVPPAPGAWAGPSYVGRPASPHPVAVAAPAHPQLAAGSPTRPGPLGLQPDVESAWLGSERCGRMELSSAAVLVAVCREGSGSRLRLVDADPVRLRASVDLPADEEGAACDDPGFYLDATDRAVVATGDRQVLAYRTSDADGEPALAEDGAWDLKPWIAHRDCLVGIAPDWAGRTWWVTRAGLVGTITPATGAVAVGDLGEVVRRGIATDETGDAYVVTDDALHRLTAGPDGVPHDVWRTAYEGPSGSPPVVVDGGLVAVTDTDDDSMGVLFVGRDGGEAVCRRSVFEKGGGATRSPLAPVGSGVVVTNNDGYSSPRSTLLGFTSSPGLARVDVDGGECVVRWTSDMVSPSSGATASWPVGLLYAWTKRPSLTGVSAWYLTAVDAADGRAMWSVRTGTGMQAGSDGSQVAIGPDGTAWLGTLSGLVRVRDRVRS